MEAGFEGIGTYIMGGAEYGRAVYCDATNSGPLWTFCLEAGSVDVLEVVGVGRLGPRGGGG